MRFVDKQQECFSEYYARNAKWGAVFLSPNLIIACLSEEAKEVQILGNFRSLQHVSTVSPTAIQDIRFIRHYHILYQMEAVWVSVWWFSG
jgi:hypothetical protein